MQIIIGKKLNKVFIAIGFALLVISCNKSSQQSKVLDVKTMSRLLYNIINQDEFVSFHILKDSTLNATTERLKGFNKALQDSKVTLEQYHTSLAWYENNPKQYRIVLDSMNQLVNKRRTERYVKPVEQYIPNRAKRDSA
jgi:ABC-type uncharacterized transport system fused permease/ATPase subunit